MKFLDLPELDHLASSLSFSSPSVRLTTRIEAYSCKPVAREKKLFSRLDSEFASDLELSTSVSPPDGQGSFTDSAFGPLDKKESRKTLWLLIATLNAAHPDHDFSRVKAEEFQREESASAVLAHFNDVVAHISEPSDAYRSFASLSISPSMTGSPLMRAADKRQLASTFPAIDPALRQILDPIIDLSECEVYSYSPDLDSDPHAADSDDEALDGDSETESVYGDDTGDGLVNDYSPMWEMDELDLGVAQTIAAVFSPTPRPDAGFHSQVSVPGTPLPLPASRPGADRPQSNPSWLRLPNTLRQKDGDYPPSSWPSPFPSLLDATEESEESSGGLLWSTYLLLYHRKKKRILFLSAWCRKLSASPAHSPPAAAHVNEQPPTLQDRDHKPFHQSLKRARSRAATPVARRSSNGSIFAPRKKVRQMRQASTPKLL